MLLRYCKIITLVLLLYGLNINLVSAENYKECNNCSPSALLNSAEQWGQSNILHGSSKNLHLIDFTSSKVTSFIVTKKRLTDKQKIITSTAQIHMNSIASPPHLKGIMNDFKREVSYLESAIAPITIPTEVVAGAWVIINCQYCKHDVNDFINSSVHGNIAAIKIALNRIEQMTGLLQTPVTNIYKLSLNDGGFLMLKVTHSNGQDLTVKIEEAVDENNNIVPFKSSDLVGKRIKVNSLRSADNINAALSAFSLRIPRQTGRVTITDGVKKGKYSN